MSQFLGIFGHEYGMSIRRKGLWIAHVLVLGFYSWAIVQDGLGQLYAGHTPWREAGEIVYMFNMLTPLIGGILTADRLARDGQLGLRELQQSAPLNRAIYVLAKYVGALASALTPILVWLAVLAGASVALGLIAPALLPAMAAAFVTITVPTYIFIVAFSLACPLVMPLRVYQVLFTGYWFWGNFMSDEIFPTVSGTLLNASGVYAQQGFFGGELSLWAGAQPYTPGEALLNIAVLSLCAAAALVIAGRYLAWQERRV